MTFAQGQPVRVVGEETLGLVVRRAGFFVLPESMLERYVVRLDDGREMQMYGFELEEWQGVPALAVVPALRLVEAPCDTEGNAA